jgi:hypothetical protein
MMSDYEKRLEKEIKREMYDLSEQIKAKKKRLVELRDKLLELGDNKDKEIENGKVKKLSYKRKKYKVN